MATSIVSIEEEESKLRNELSNTILGEKEEYGHGRKTWYAGRTIRDLHRFKSGINEYKRKWEYDNAWEGKSW